MKTNAFEVRCVRCPKDAPLVPPGAGDLHRYPGERPYVTCALHTLIERVPKPRHLDAILGAFPRKDPLDLSREIAPYEFQARDSRRVASVRSLLIGSQMGSGKSLVAAIGALRGDMGNVIFCPTSVKWNWQREIQRWRPDLTSQVVGTKVQWSLPLPGVVQISSWGLLPGEACVPCKNGGRRACAHRETWVVRCGDGRRHSLHTSEEQARANVEALDKKCDGLYVKGSKLERRPDGEPCPGTAHAVESEPLANPLPEIAKPYVLVADEVHYLQNKTARRRRWDLFADRVWDAGGRLYGLTGTIVSNSPSDLYEILSCLKLERAAFPGGFEQFVGIFEEWFMRRKGERAAPSGERREELLEALKPVRICRLRKHVLAHLPPVQEKVLQVDLDKNTLAEVDEAVQKLLAVRRAWEDVQAKIVANPWGKELGANGKLQALEPDEKARRVGLWEERVQFYFETRPWVTDEELRSAVAEALETRHESPTITELSRIRAILALAKLNVALEIVEKHEREEEPLLVFCQHVAILEKLLGGRAGWALYTGKVPQKARDEVVLAFQKGEIAHGIGISITAGGEGINLTRAGSMLFVDSHFNPGKNDQAAARVQRPGAERHDVLILTKLVANHAVDHLLMVTLREKSQIHVAVEDDVASREGMELQRA